MQLKRDIEVVPSMPSNTLHKFRPFMKFHADIHFIYMTARGDEHKEVLHSYYKLIEEELEEITKEWPVELLIPVDPVELSDPELIRTLVVTREGYDTPGTNRRKKTSEVQKLKNASKETASESPSEGGDDEVDKEENNGEEDKKKQGEVTPLHNPPDDVEPSKKRKVSPMKPTSRKKSKSSKTKL
jgi:hypothetical protein